MKRESLKVEKRKILGKQVKKLRREGILPANIYGKDIKSQAVQLKETEFAAVFKKAGETSLVDVVLGAKTIPVLIHNVTRDSLSKALLHADFFQVNLKEKIKAMVPVVIVDTAKAVFAFVLKKSSSIAKTSGE